MKMKWWKGYSPTKEIEIQLTLADKVSRLVIHSASAREVAQKTVAELAGLMSIDWATLALVDKPAGSVHLTVLVDGGNPPDSEEDKASGGGFLLEKTIPLDGTPFALVAEKKQALLEPDLRRVRLLPSPILAQGLRAVVYMPLFYQGEVYGIFSLGSHRPQAYQEAQLRLLRHAVAHVAIALKGALLLEQNQKTEASLATLNELLGIITSSRELPEVLPQFAQRLRKVVSFDRLSLAHVLGSTLRILALFDEKGSLPKQGETCLVGDSAIPWLQEHGEINVEEDFAREKQFPIDELHFREGFRGEIRVPLFSQGRLFASLHLVSAKPYHLGELGEELTFLRQLAHYVATPVESYVLYANERQRLGWFAALSHRLRNPLTAIVSSSGLLADELETKEAATTLVKLAQNISRGAQIMNRNIRLFWDWTEAESSGFSLMLEAVDPEEILSQAVQDAEPTAQTKGQSLVLELPATLPRVSADPSRIAQVLHLLLDNALIASPQGKKIVLQAKVVDVESHYPSDKAAKELAVEVSDAGPGFAPEEKERLLRPFRLAEADRMPQVELALSLSICRRIVELHGGRLWLESKPGEGNIVGFSLPLATAWARFQP